MTPDSLSSVEAVAERLRAFLERHPEGAVLEDGKTVFELRSAQHRVRAEHGRCVLELWSGERTLIRTVAGATERSGALRLTTTRFGQAGTRTLVLVPVPERREPNRREPARQRYLRLLERVLAREFVDWQPEGFRVAMDLERSFGPAYARGSLVKGKEAWAVIGVGAAESQAVIDGVLTLGVLWLHHCRERSDGRLLYKGLRLILPRGAATLTLARLPWMNEAAAQWELFELDERSEELETRDPDDQGNLRTQLMHHPDQSAARERFGVAIEALYALLPESEQGRVEQRLRSTTELCFLLHGLQFARARLLPVPGSFAQRLELRVGAGAEETVLTDTTARVIAGEIGALLARRHAHHGRAAPGWQPSSMRNGIGAFTGRPAHHRTGAAEEAGAANGTGLGRLEQRERALAAQGDPLYRAAPERWLESVLRENLAPLTRSLAPLPEAPGSRRMAFANDEQPDNFGNREIVAGERDRGWTTQASVRPRGAECLIPRFDPRFVYSQVPAIAGASDRGLLDLLGITEDGRLAVIEIKVADDLQLALQGLDYWIRVRHHHLNPGEAARDLAKPGSEWQQHGYFQGVELSPKAPRLFLVAPALHIHPATETVLRYLSPRVEWTLLALDERWRQQIRVVWRKSGGGVAAPWRKGR